MNDTEKARQRAIESRFSKAAGFVQELDGYLEALCDELRSIEDAALQFCWESFEFDPRNTDDYCDECTETADTYWAARGWADKVETLRKIVAALV